MMTFVTVLTRSLDKQALMDWPLIHMCICVMPPNVTQPCYAACLEWQPVLPDPRQNARYDLTHA